MNEKKERPVYTLHELLEQYDESTARSDEDIIWENLSPVGRERFWDEEDCEEVNSRKVVAYALKSCNGVYHKFFTSHEEAAARLPDYEKELNMVIVELVENP